jgi:hypothetical protein
MTIAEIKSIKDGSTVDSLSGLVENVYERHAGSKNGKAWSLQNIILKDSAGIVKVLLDGRKECPKSMEGKAVSFSSVNGEKGLTGMFAKDDTYNGKTTRIVKVTSVAAVKVIEGDRTAVVAAKVYGNSGDAAPRKPMVLGQTVGMAINNSVHIILQGSGPHTIEYFAGDEFIYDLHAVASSIIHVSKSLESGEELKRPQELPARKEEPRCEHGDEADSNFLEGGQADPEIF